MMDELDKDKKPEAPSPFEALAKRKMESFVPGTLAERYATGSGGLRYVAALHGSNRRPTRTKQPEEESGARLIKDMLSEKQAALMSNWDHDYFYEMVQQLVADKRMKDYQPDSLFFAHRTGVVKTLTDELGLTPVQKNLDNNPVFRRADLEAKLREDPKALGRLAERLDVDISSKSSIKTAVTGAPSAFSQDEMIEKVMKSSHLYNERMLSLTQDMKAFCDAIGASYERKPGGHYVVAENSFIAKMIETKWEG